MNKLISTVLIIACCTAFSFGQYNMHLAFPNLTFSNPVEMVNSGDGTNRLFVVTQLGIIYVFPNDSLVSNPKIFLNLSDSVTQSGGEMGLLGLAFHPDYAANGYFYVDYTTNQLPLRTKISRFQVSASNPDSAVRTSELVLITVNQPFQNHNGGKIAFGPDDYFYISLGDGGSGGDPQNNAQNKSVLLGKILRINVDSSSGGNNYSIPVSNPFYNNTQGWREEIFVYGLRNTWKFSFDNPTARIWAADVGQNAWEEIDIIENGKNYGWRIMEGFTCYNPPTGCDTTGLTLPIWAYPRTEGQSVTGGYVYRGPSIPELTGKYIYADYVSGRIWALTYDGINPPVNVLLYDSPYFISTFGVDELNELYICTHGPSGQIYKLDTTPIGIGNNQLPGYYILNQNYPNPFNPETKIVYYIPKETFVTIKIFDALGREVETLVNEPKHLGTYEVIWNAAGFPSGVYFYTMNSGIERLQKKMVLVK